MISCTEFIPSYSEFFSYIHQRDGYSGVEDFWAVISDTYIKPRLGKAVSEEGIKGCFTYWSHTLNEEAAGFTMNLDEEKGYFEILMHNCPSKRRLISYEQINRYKYYCYHCDFLYRRVLEPYGFLFFYDTPKGDEYHCKLRVIDPKVATSDFIEDTKKLYGII